ncbi:MAG: PDZ domain-containing protein [Planctomycetes bacterium]|nr:PDZ domain-containing protein [Planctomycetota bacterium]
MRPLPLIAALALLALPAAAEDKKPVTVHFDLEANLIWVSVKLDGKGPFRLAVDTGASTTVVLPGVAKELGLIDKDDKGGGLFNLSPTFVKVKKLQVDKLELADIKVAVMQIPQLSLPAGLMRMEAHGVLGYNFISRFVTTFDYKEQTITFVPSDYVPADPTENLPGVTKPARSWLGVTIEEADPRDTRRQGYDGGLEVQAVEDISPAEKAGIKVGDVIVDIAGTPTIKAETLREWLRRAAPGQKVVVTFIRDGELWEADVTIGKVRAK